MTGEPCNRLGIERHGGVHQTGCSRSPTPSKSLQPVYVVLQHERYREIFADLVRLNVDVIVTYSTEMAQEAKAVTAIVSIVAVGAADGPG
jgi:hypothetical protein